MSAYDTSALREIADSLEPHVFACDPDEGGKPDGDCLRCRLEDAILNIQLDEERIAQLKHVALVRENVNRLLVAEHHADEAMIAKLTDALDAYKQGEGISSLEVMPSQPAILRLARFLYSQEMGSHAGPTHKALMKAWDQGETATHSVEYWMTQARAMLRAATGLPAQERVA